jgi:2-methylisocitrate lyase-like PEP mutase family enzyme
MSVDTHTSAERARVFRSLHQAEGLLVLPNAWDVITARVFEDGGFSAVGTTSFGIARAHGFRDGDNAAREVTRVMAGRMAEALSVPLSADIEAGYGETPREVEAEALKLIEAGVVGFNIEDGQTHASPPLADVALQCAKIAALRSAAATAGVPVFVNARTDVFWLRTHKGSAALAESLRRAAAYLSAGADGIFIPGLVDRDAISEAVTGIQAPLNILASPQTPAAAELAALGVKRLSLGSGPVRATLGLLRRLGREVKDRGTYAYLEDAIPYDEANAL